MLPNLGIALGAGTRQYLQMDKEEKDDAFRQQQIDLQKEANLRSQQMHDTQMDQIKRQNAEREAANAVWKEALPVFQGGWQAAAKHLGEAYNADDAGYGYNDGKKVNFQVHKNGVYVTPMNPDGSGGQTQFYSPEQVMQEHLRGVHARLASISPAYAQGFMSWLDGQNKEATRQKERGEDKAFEEKKFAHTVERDKADDALKLKQIGISGAHLGLAQQKWTTELADIKTKREYEAKIRDIRTKLSEATDPAEIEKYKFQLQALSGSDKGDQYRYEIKQYEDEQGNKRLAKVDRHAGVVEQVEPQPKTKAAASGGAAKVRSREEADKYWSTYEKQFNGDKEAYYKRLGV